MVSMLKADVNSKLDSLQFVYRHDAITAIMHLVLNHLEDSRAYARLNLIAFSSAFNTLEPYLFIQKLRQLDFNSSVIKWYHSFLTNRTVGLSSKPPST